MLREGANEVGTTRQVERNTTGVVIEVNALSRRYGDVTAVDAVSFSIQRGEIFGLIGPNGAGKSTLIKMLTTLLPPTSGQALVAGFDIARAAQQVRKHTVPSNGTFVRLSTMA